MDDWGKLRERLNRSFAHWDIELPIDALKPGVVWLVVQRGWTIWTKFETSTEDGRPHIDYYAMHRMTNDCHVRLYADGDTKSLPTIESWMTYPADATKAEVKALEEEQASRNPGGGTTVGNQGLRHDGRCPPQRPNQPLSRDAPGTARRRPRLIGLSDRQGAVGCDLWARRTATRNAPLGIYLGRDAQPGSKAGRANLAQVEPVGGLRCDAVSAGMS